MPSPGTHRFRKPSHPRIEYFDSTHETLAQTRFTETRTWIVQDGAVELLWLPGTHAVLVVLLDLAVFARRTLFACRPWGKCVRGSVATYEPLAPALPEITLRG